MENQLTPRFINPFTDFGFKKIFGEEANKDLLIDFLNELLSFQNQHIKDLIFKKNERLGQTGLDRNVVFDLFCENEKGEKFTVELQKAKQSFFKDRMLYYSSFSIQEQGIKGNWNYELKAVYVIGILDFIIEEEQADKIVVSHNKIMDIDRHKVFYDKLSFITLQMPNFNKTANELETNFDKWLFVIKNLYKLQEIPERLQTKIFKKLFKVANYSAMDKIERDKYEDSLKYYRDLKNSLDTAFDDGKKEGYDELMPLLQQEREKAEQKSKELEQEREKAEQEREKAEQKSKELEQEREKAEQEREKAEQKSKELEQERQKAEQEREKAEQKSKELAQERKKLIETIKKMKLSGLSNEQISTFTGLSIDEIKKLK